MEIWEILIQQWRSQHIGEVFAVCFAIVYVWLASEESIWCWPAGFISTSLYAFLFFDVTLIFQMVLNLYYMIMAVYGFITWRKSADDKVSITRMTLLEHAFILCFGILMTVLSYLVTKNWFSYDLLLLDAAITIFSLITTYLTVKKRLECWIYWSFINLASIFLFLESQLYLSIVLMLIYIVIAIRGLLLWQKSYDKQILSMNSQAI